MDFEDNDDENFDKPDPKAKLHDKKDKDDEFGEDNEDVDTEELNDLDVEVEDVKPEKKEEIFKAKPEEERFGKRRNKHKFKDARATRELETKLNQQMLRNDQLEERLKAVESNTSRISDSQINEAQRYLQQAKNAHASAVKDGDGDAAAEALDVMMEAKETLTLLNANKKRNEVTQPRKEIQQTTQTPVIDQVVLRKFDEWHEDNEWYDPALRDKYSRIAYYIDNAINAEGYNPRTPEYWREFEKRCRANPTLAKEVYGKDDSQEDDGMDDAEYTQQNAEVVKKRSSPQNERSGSGGGGGRKKIVVSRERADAMRQMGLQPGTQEWKRMAKKYETYDKQRKA